MKYSICLLLAYCLLWSAACSDSGEDSGKEPGENSGQVTPPAPEQVEELKGNDARKFMLVIEKTDPKMALVPDMSETTDEQYAEIKAYTSELVKGKSGYDAYKAIFTWIHKNVKFGTGDNSPYAVFKNKVGVCFGFANLQKMMCISQEIPALGVIGWLDPGPQQMGHAWNYVYAGDKWYVSDALNNYEFDVKNVSKYYSLLEPWRSDIALAEDDNYVYGYERGLNISRVKAKSEKIVLPDAVLGYYIGTFSPQGQLPAEVKEVTFGEHIASLGESDNRGLDKNAPGLQRISVAEGNKSFEGYEGSVYVKGVQSGLPFYVPKGAVVVKLKAAEFFDKNEALFEHAAVEEIYFAEGTGRIGSGAVEKCPKLKKVHVPRTTQYDEGAFPKGVEVIRF